MKFKENYLWPPQNEQRTNTITIKSIHIFTSTKTTNDEEYIKLNNNEQMAAVRNGEERPSFITNSGACTVRTRTQKDRTFQQRDLPLISPSASQSRPTRGGNRSRVDKKSVFTTATQTRETIAFIDILLCRIGSF